MVRIIKLSNYVFWDIDPLGDCLIHCLESIHFIAKNASLSLLGGENPSKLKDCYQYNPDIAWSFIRLSFHCYCSLHVICL